MKPDHEFQDLLARLDATLRGAPQTDAFSTAELAAASGLSTVTATRTVRKLVLAGLIEYAGRAMRPSMIGVMYPVPVYRRVKDAKLAEPRSRR